MRTAATNRRLRSILTGLRNTTLVPNPEFQRRLVWSNRHKMAFLETVLQGLPFPEIFIAAGTVDTETGEGTELIVDGQQRVTTLFQYFTDSPDLKIVGIPKYHDLGDDEKTDFLEYEVVVRDLGSLTDDQTRDLFYRINSTSYSLNAMEVNNARYEGVLKRFCDALSEDQFFEDHRTFSVYDTKRMNDVRWVLTLIITMMSAYFNRDNEHQSFLERYNDELPPENELKNRFGKAVNTIDSLQLSSKSRVWQKSDLFTLMVEIDRGLSRGLRVSNDAAERLNQFYGKVDRIAKGDASEQDTNAQEYFAATRSGTNDRSSRWRRGKVIFNVVFGDRAHEELALFPAKDE